MKAVAEQSGRLFYHIHFEKLVSGNAQILVATNPNDWFAKNGNYL